MPARINISVLPSGPARRPVLLMALGSFTVGTDAFVISGVLPPLGRDLGVDVSTAGLLITVFAAVYAVAAPFLAVATGNLDRRKVLLYALGGFITANAVAAVATDYTIMMIARVAAALSAALFMPAASASAAAIVAPEERGRALTAVLGGLTVASAVGVPLGVSLGHLANWQATFAFVAVLSAVALLGLMAALPKISSAGVATLGERVRAITLPGVPSVLLGSMFTFCSMFVLYAYLAWFVQRTAGFDGGEVTWIYLTYGVCGVVSNLVTGWLIDQHSPHRVAAIASFLLIAVSALFCLQAWVGSQSPAAAALAFVVVAIWALVGWAVNPSQQKRLINAGGPHGSVVLSLSGSAVYAGQAFGSLVGSFTLAHGALALAATALGLQVVTSVVILSPRERATRSVPAT